MDGLKKFLHHVFVPKESNNFRAKALHIDTLTYYLVVAVVISFFFQNVNGRFGDVLGYATDITAEKLLQLTNEQRVKQNLAPLSFNEKLSSAAYQKAQDMFAKNYWAHYSPEGTTPWDFILTSGYKYELAGENLAKNFLFSQGVVDAWMASSTHKENILKQDYTEVGYAVANGVLNGEPTTLVVQIFGRPMGFTLVKEEAPIETEVQAEEKVVPASQPKPILARATKNTQSLLPRISLQSNYIFFLFLLLVLVLDFYIAAKNNIVRIAGKNIAHIIFISFILFSLWLVTKGAVL